MKTQVLNSAVTKINSRSFHTYWQDVNPIRSTRLDPDKVYTEVRDHIRKCAAQRRVLSSVRVLPDLTR